MKKQHKRQIHIISQYGKFIVVKDIIKYAIQINLPDGKSKTIASNLPLKNADTIAKSLNYFKAEHTDF